MYSKSNNEIIAETMYKLLREKSYHSITQLDLLRISGLNRATLHRSFENVEVLFRYICESERNELRSLYLNREAKTPEQLYAVARDFVLAVYNRTDRLALLTGPNGDPSLLCHSPIVFKENMWKKAVDGGFADGYIRFLLGVDAAVAVLWLYYSGFAPEYEKAEHMADVYRDFEISGSLFDDVARVMSAESGGKPEEQKQLLVSAIQMLDTYDGHVYSVSKLLQDTSVSRVRFYKYYRSIDDFLARKRVAVQFVSSLYLKKAATGTLENIHSLHAEIDGVIQLYQHHLHTEDAPLNRYLLDILSSNLVLALRRMCPDTMNDKNLFTRMTYYLTAVQHCFIYASVESDVSEQNIMEYLERLRTEMKLSIS